MFWSPVKELLSEIQLADEWVRERERERVCVEKEMKVAIPHLT